MVGRRETASSLGKLDRLQALDNERFKLKYKEAFGFDYAGK